MIRPERVLRADLGAISNREATELLETMGRLVSCEVAAVRGGAVSCPGLDSDDLTAIANIAVLEARATWVDGRGRSLRSWVQCVVRWRLRETLQASMQPREVSLDATANFDSVVAGLRADIPATPDGLTQAKFAEVFQRTMAGLAPADRVLVQQAVAGVSRAETARQLSRGYTEVCHATTAALAVVRRECSVFVGKRVE